MKKSPTCEELETRANVKKKIETEEIWQEVCIMVQRRGGEREGNLGHQGGRVVISWFQHNLENIARLQISKSYTILHQKGKFVISWF